MGFWNLYKYRRTMFSCLDIPYRWGNKDGFVFHDIRHTVNTDMRRAGIQQSVIMAILGYEDHRMFNRYNTVDLEDLKNAMVQLEDYRQEILNVDQTVDHVAENDI